MPPRDDAAWYDHLEKLKEFKKKNGHCRVPHGHGKLANWVSEQRKLCKKGRLIEQRFQKLQELGFTWVVHDPFGNEWLAMFANLQKFQEENGHFRVPPHNRKLNRWAIIQRMLYNKGKLNEERCQKLQELGFTWVVHDSSDPDWSAMFATLQNFNQERGHCRVSTRDGKLGTWVRTQRRLYSQGKLNEERFQKLQELGFTWVVSASSDPLQEDWLAMFANLQQFQERHGHCRVPQGDGKLGTWVSTQRKVYNKGKLNEERFQKLQEIGFTWVISGSSDPLGEDWLAMFASLQKFHQGNGHCNVPRTNGKLGKWVSTQRTLYKKGKLNGERFQKLQELGFTWIVSAPSDPLREDWTAMFAKLQKFQEEKGHCRVPKADGKLGTWVSTQRKVYNNGKLNDERFQKLQELGFTWVVSASSDPLREGWLAMLATLQNFQEENGHCRVPRAAGKLGTWVNTQRNLYRNGKLNDERFQKLQELGLTWVVHDSSGSLGREWLAMFANLQNFQEEHGHCRVPQHDGKLYSWVSTQRYYHNKGKLNEERFQKLQELGFTWVIRGPSDPLGEGWLAMLATLQNFQEENGHCRVPRAAGKLGTWVNTQRKLYSNGKLNDERFQKLQELGFIWNPTKSAADPLGAQWLAMFAELKKFQDEHSHCRVPRMDGKLGGWVYIQLRLYSQGKLNEERYQKLQELGFTWVVSGNSSSHAAPQPRRNTRPQSSRTDGAVGQKRKVGADAEDSDWMAMKKKRRKTLQTKKRS
ncbi:helicase [Seminavis robusta]|uniref:Helicase n=1 Tax=Seminavis robusta TaxID=568900 RepID=A0A9N8ERD7_9STRA|nr:helicase [Seminavis robusta]|eukprot:Sro1568_g283060.1 helicase (753) ;mRNA; f:11700-13958